MTKRVYKDQSQRDAARYHRIFVEWLIEHIKTEVQVGDDRLLRSVMLKMPTAHLQSQLLNHQQNTGTE